MVGKQSSNSKTLWEKGECNLEQYENLKNEFKNFTDDLVCKLEKESLSMQEKKEINSKFNEIKGKFGSFLPNYPPLPERKVLNVRRTYMDDFNTELIKTTLLYETYYWKEAEEIDGYYNGTNSNFARLGELIQRSLDAPGSISTEKETKTMTTGILFWKKTKTFEQPINLEPEIRNRIGSIVGGLSYLTEKSKEINSNGLTLYKKEESEVRRGPYYTSYYPDPLS